jgi:hypothetical protein
MGTSTQRACAGEHACHAPLAAERPTREAVHADEVAGRMRGCTRAKPRAATNKPSQAGGDTETERTFSFYLHGFTHKSNILMPFLIYTGVYT